MHEVIASNEVVELNFPLATLESGQPDTAQADISDMDDIDYALWDDPDFIGFCKLLAETCREKLRRQSMPALPEPRPFAISERASSATAPTTPPSTSSAPPLLPSVPCEVGTPSGMKMPTVIDQDGTSTHAPNG